MELFNSVSIKIPMTAYRLVTISKLRLKWCVLWLFQHLLVFSGRQTCNYHQWVCSVNTRQGPNRAPWLSWGGAKPLIRGLPDFAGCLGSAECNFLVSHDGTVFTEGTQRWRKMLRLRIPVGWARYKSGQNCQFEPCRMASSPQSFPHRVGV